MRPMIVVLAALLLAGCNSAFQTLRPAAGGQPAIQAQIVRPEGPGPFPAVVILHGCAGPISNGPQWAGWFREAGFLSAIADQFAPHGVTEQCTQIHPRMNVSSVRLRDTYDLVRILQARPDVQPDRVFLIGFSMGHYLTAVAMTDHWDLLAPNDGKTPPPRPRGGIAVYGVCLGLSARTHGPLLFVLAGLDDWAPPEDCVRYAEHGWRAGVRPRVLLLEGAHHSFDSPDLRSTRFDPRLYNPNVPSGFGATNGPSTEATARARGAVLAFLNEHR